MTLIFNCPHCGGQNFVASQRLNHRERSVVCWICNRTFSWTFLEELTNGRRRAEKVEKLSMEGGENG